MRFLALTIFFLAMYYIGYKRGRPVTYQEQFNFVGSLFVISMLLVYFGLA